MARVNDLQKSPPSKTALISPARLGVLCCVLAAISYAAAGICMKKLAQLDCDPTWAVFHKELFAVLAIGPWLLAEALRGRPLFPALKVVGMIALTGLFVQLVGNLGQQWSLGIVGLAVTVPVMVGTMLLSSACFGWWVLREAVSPRSTLALGLLIVSLILLGGAAKAAGAPAAGPASSGLILAAVAAAGMAGVIYAVLSIVIRHTLQGTIRLSMMMFLVTGMGVISLGPINFFRFGGEIWATTPAEQWGWILAAGFFNLLGFLSISKGLQLTTVVYANVVNASEVAMAAVAGVLLFREAPGPLLIGGVALTIGGILLIDRPQTASETVDTAV